MRKTLLLVGFALVVASCGSASSESTDAPAASTPSTVPATTVTSADPGTITAPPDDSTTSTTAPVSKPEGPNAPDFTLALGETGADEFALSQEVKPVFMVFWAEW